MFRFRGLTLLTLALSIVGLRYALVHLPSFGILGAEPAAWELVFSALLLFMCPFFIVTTTAMMILSFFSLSVANDGAFLIRRKSLYGKVFLRFARPGWDRELSFCRIFWKTNWTLMAFSVLIGLIVFGGFGIVQAGIWKVLQLVFFILFCFAIVGLLSYGCVKVAETRTWQTVKGSKTASVAGTTMLSVVILAIAALCVIGLWFLVTGVSLTWIGLIVGGVLLIIGVVKGTTWAWERWLADSHFGIALAIIYKAYLCPRLRIE